jgi:hypothetical protein
MGHREALAQLSMEENDRSGFNQDLEHHLRDLGTDKIARLEESQTHLPKFRKMIGSIVKLTATAGKLRQQTDPGSWNTHMLQGYC